MSILVDLKRRFRCLLALPPHLANEVTMDSYREFMQEETFSYSPRYAKQRVVIHNAQALEDAATDSGALIAFMHYGSFFLMGGAVRHQLGLPYTAIASRRNLNVMTPSDKTFWHGAHKRSGKLYEKALFFSDEKVMQSRRWLEKPKHTLGVALDVHEIDFPQPRYPFEFLGRQVFLPIAPARLAKIANVSLVPAAMHFDVKTSCHHLQFFTPIQVISPTDATQMALCALEGRVRDDPNQQFFDAALAFSKPD